MSEQLGFIALSRGILDHPVVGVKRGQPYSRTEAWQWLLLEAAYKPRRYDAGGKVIELQRGQLAHSTRYMARAWNWPETNVRNFLDRLKSGAGTGAMIGAEIGAGVTVITICNYDAYQSAQKEVGAEIGAGDGAGNGALLAQSWRRKEQGNNLTKYNTRSRAQSNEMGGFAEWYSLYPRKTARLVAAKAFRAYQKRNDLPLADLMARTRAFADAWADKPKDERKYIPHPASWLNAGRYLDSPETSDASGGQVTKPPRDPREFTDSEWQEKLGLYKSGQGWAATLWGPAPGEPGCLVPSKFLIEVAA